MNHKLVARSDVARSTDPARPSGRRVRARTEAWPSEAIPALESRRQWRIKRSALDQHIDTQSRGGEGGRDGM